MTTYQQQRGMIADMQKRYRRNKPPVRKPGHYLRRSSGARGTVGSANESMVRRDGNHARHAGVQGRLPL
uniref:Uncharacterized protein eiDWFOrf44 n=2 Tax=unclassified bacterial viruses TaxID=12333 RepID=E7EKY7_9VIRU|nr:unknown [Edwardsiella phage eiDWF]ADV36541.1 unknown [Edwardsiella phage eiMSLS]